jgi:hypothetical protein
MRGFLLPLLLSLSFGVGLAEAEDLVTREYWLKNQNATTIIQALNIVIRNATGKRILGGQGKHLVVTDTEDQQEQIAEMLPVLDQVSKETNSDKVIMGMVSHAAAFMHEKKKTNQMAKQSTPGPPAASSSADSSGVHTYDTLRSTRPYKSVYVEEDAKLARKRRILEDEGALPSLSDLVLKGLFKSSSGSPLALLAYGNTNFVARGGGLYERNQLQVKGVASEVQKDRVILVGPDRIRRELKFKSTL